MRSRAGEPLVLKDDKVYCTLCKVHITVSAKTKSTSLTRQGRNHLYG